MLRKLTGAGYSKFSSEIAVLHIDQTTGTTSSKEFTVNVSFTTFLLMMYYLSRVAVTKIDMEQEMRVTVSDQISRLEDVCTAQKALTSH